MLLVVLAVTLVAALAEYRNLLKRKRKRDVVVSACFLAVGVAAGLLEQAGIPLPSPLAGIVFIFKPAGDLLDRILS
ncbi:hypothetical protein [Gorillibacterium sp. sgz500922]|uniref:hypothetical protein n=1 Tax=Gorillibacterium sp. sgz500922 TaxID=3446694 RepID=UPI003F6663B7